jgi:hypothetical protein
MNKFLHFKIRSMPNNRATVLIKSTLPAPNMNTVIVLKRYIYILTKKFA